MLLANPVLMRNLALRTWLWTVAFSLAAVSAWGQTLAWEPNEPLIVCPGTEQTVGVRVVGTFGAGNRFRVELSDASGSFAAPQVVGFIDRGGPLDERLEIRVLFPDVPYTSADYRLRAVSTAPEQITPLRRLIFVALNVAQRNAETCENGNGTLDVTFNTAGGAAQLYFANRPPEPVQGNSSASFANLSAGSYAVELRTAAGCTLRRQAELERRWSTRLVSASANVTSSCTSADGLISFEITLPANNFIELRIEDSEGRVLFDWRQPLRLLPNGNGNREFSYPTDFAGPPAGLRAGSYRVLLRDNAGCLNQRIVEVRSPENPTINDITTVRAPRCGADATGEIRVEAEGNGQLQLFLDGRLVASGTEPFDVRIGSLPAARYRLRLLDGNGCLFETDYTLEAQEQDFTIFTETQAPTCGQTNAVLRIWAEPPGDYRFSVDGGPEQTSGRFDGLSGGLTLSVSVRDAVTGCVRTTVADIDEGTRPVFEVSLSREPTCNDPTGDFLLVASDVVEPVQFFVNGELRSECLGVFCSIANLPAGTAHRFRMVDASGCEADTLINLQLMGQPRLSQVAVVPPCAGQANGSLTFGVTGQGLIRVTVDGPGGAVPNSGASPLVVSRSNLRAGEYRITVVDDNNCPAETTVVLRDLDSIEIRVTASNSTCQDLFSGSLLIEVLSGPPGLMFSLGPPPFAARTPDPFFINLGRGTYTVFAFDPTREDCFVQSPPVEVIELNYLRDLLEAPGVQVPPLASCFNASTGEIRLELPPALIELHGLIFSINGGGTWLPEPRFRNLAPGTYRLLVRDRDGCEHELTGLVVLASPAIELSVQVIQPTCTDPTGSIIAAATGGTPPLTYLLSTIDDPNSGSYQQVGLFAGLPAPNRYYVFVRDGRGCTVAAPANPISLEPSRAATLGLVDFYFPSCIGASDGWVAVRANGTAPFRFSGDGVNFTAPQADPLYRFNGFAAGDYTLTVEDAAGCTATTNFRPRDPQPLTVVELPAETRGPTCSEGPLSGYITINGEGGNSPAQKADPNAPRYEYSIDGVVWQTSARFGGLAAGTYTVRVRLNGASNCPAAERQITLAAPPLLFVDAFEIRRQPCPNTALNPGGGRMYLRVRGGDPANPPRLSLLDASTLAEEDFFVGFEYEFQNLRAKNYSLTAVDANTDCEIDPIENVELEASPAVTVDAVLRPPTCPGNTDGAIELRATGGTPDRLYSRDGTTYGPDPVFGGLAAGSGPFAFFVRDNSLGDPLFNQCVYRVAVPGPLPDAAPLPSLTGVTWTETSCNSFVLEATAQGGTAPLEFVLSLGGSEIERNRSGVFESLPPGRYRVEVVDARPCASVAREVELQGSNSNLDLSLQTTDPRCADPGSIVATANPAGRYEYSLNGGPWQTGNRFDNLDAGTYTVRARQLDPPNCELPSRTATLSGAAVPRITYDVPSSLPSCGGQAAGRLTLEARTTNGTLTVVLRRRGGGAPLQSFTAPPSSSPFVFNNLAADEYDILLSDDSGCPPLVVPASVSERPRPSLSVQAAAPVCPAGTEAQPADLLEGSFTLTANGGTPPYRYAFQGETPQTDPVFRRDAGGNPLQVAVPYRFVVIDAEGCESAVQPAVLSPALPLAMTDGPQADPLRPLCDRPEVGVRLTGTAVGGGELRFQLVDAGGVLAFAQEADQGSFTFTDVRPGSYRLRVLDERAGGTCTLTVVPDVLIEPGPSQELLARVLANPSCGIDNGEIEIEVISGFDSPWVLLNGLDVSNYRFENNIFQNLPENTYVLRVEERREPRCFVEQTFDLRAVGSIALEAEIGEQRPCFGGADGRWFFRASGGTNLVFRLERLDDQQQPIESWQNSTGLFGNLSEGRYRLTLTNDEGCRAQRENLTLTAYDELTAQPLYEGPTCADPTRLRLTVDARGGAGAYEFSVDGGASWHATDEARILDAGQTFTLTVRDTAGCAFAGSFTAPSAASGLEVSLGNVQQPRCATTADGWAEIAAVGGVPPYRYSLDGGPLADLPASGRIEGLAGGRGYAVLVVDASEPPCSSAVLDVRLEVPAAVVLTLSEVQAPTCHDRTDGRFTVEVSGGEADYQLAVFRDGQSYDQLTNLRPDAPETYTDLPVGLYRLVATDANRCTAEEELDFRVPPVEAGTDHTLCAVYWRTGEQRILDLSGWGSPAGGQWSGAGVQGNVLTYGEAELGRDLELVYAVGACRDTLRLRIEALQLEADVAACTGDALDLQALPAGGIWVDESDSLPQGALSGSRLDLAGVPAGRYRLVYRTASGCQAVQVVIVNPLPDAAFRIETPERERVVNEAIRLLADRTQPDWAHRWRVEPTGGSASGTSASVRCTEPGRHTAIHTVETATGCRAVDSVAFEVLPLPQLQLPTVFTPNGDGINDRFPTLGGTDGLRPEMLRNLAVFDRTGQRVWVWERGGPGWDGTRNGREVAAGVYYWRAEFQPLDAPRPIVRTGQVTLLR